MKNSIFCILLVTNGWGQLSSNRGLGQLKSAAHQKKTPTQNMKGMEDNKDDRKRQGHHKRQAQIWTDIDKTNKSVCIAPAIQTCI